MRGGFPPQVSHGGDAGAGRETVRDAFWVPILRPQEAELVSERLRSYPFHPVWSSVADQAWLR